MVVLLSLYSTELSVLCGNVAKRLRGMQLCSKSYAWNVVIRGE